MPSIKFSHDYPKLHGQTSARLIEVTAIDYENLHPDLIEYDTKTCKGDYYPLPKTQLIYLLFVGNKKIPFCTLRRLTPLKLTFCIQQIGKEFNIIMEGKNG